MVLILTSATDCHADIVQEKIRRTGVSCVRFNTEDYPCQIQLQMEFGHSFISGGLADHGKIVVHVDDITAVWFRRPVPSNITEQVQQPEAKRVAEDEATVATRGFWTALYDRFWMSWPWSIFQANQKLMQLRLASELGFIVPRTVVTQTHADAERVYRECGGTLVVKSLSGVFLEDSNQTVFTSLVRETDLNEMQSNEVCPTMFQAYVPKDADVRVTVVGQEVFACAMRSQGTTDAEVDWRRGSVGSIPHEKVCLPRVVESRCLELVRRLRLSFGAIDLIRTASDEYVFLEINPNGQWAWIEALTGLPISDRIAALLADPPANSRNI